MQESPNKTALFACQGINIHTTMPTLPNLNYSTGYVGKNKQAGKDGPLAFQHVLSIRLWTLGNNVLFVPVWKKNKPSFTVVLDQQFNKDTTLQ